MASELRIDGLSCPATSPRLRGHLVQHGTVESATVVTDRLSGQSRGFGCVEMFTEPEAQEAIVRLNDQMFEARRHLVNVAKVPSTGGDGSRRPLRW
jgi:RNA recognition motif-containing protein